jgi:hypothetical protein
MPSTRHSITAKWPATKEKCWALFYWNHIGRRQTAPVQLHGLELTDPIRQFNDYGYTMCSTISGINCGLWYDLGLPARFWDISLHTVPEVYYDGRWHMYDNSMSALYTLCDGSTIAGVEDIGGDGACAASGGRRERGHVAKYHCLYSTGPNGFLTGADTARSLDEEARCFNPNGLKYREGISIPGISQTQPLVERHPGQLYVDGRGDDDLRNFSVGTRPAGHRTLRAVPNHQQTNFRLRRPRSARHHSKRAFRLAARPADEAGPVRNQPPYDDGPANSGVPGTSPRGAERKREAE